MKVPFPSILDGIRNTYNISNITARVYYDWVMSPYTGQRVRRTNVVIQVRSSLDGNTYEATGRAYCNANTQFVKHTGRVLALRRALNQLKEKNIRRVAPSARMRKRQRQEVTA